MIKENNKIITLKFIKNLTHNWGQKCMNLWTSKIRGRYRATYKMMMDLMNIEDYDMSNLFWIYFSGWHLFWYFNQYWKWLFGFFRCCKVHCLHRWHFFSKLWSIILFIETWPPLNILQDYSLQIPRFDIYLFYQFKTR